MTHQGWVFLTGALFIASGGIMTVVFRLLGPTYHTRISASWGHRLAVFLIAAFLVVRGALFVFPGRLVRVDHMSPLMPLGGLCAVAMALILLDFVMRERSPPPWSVMMIRLFAVLGRDREAIRLAMTAPPAGLIDRPAADVPPPVLRWGLLTGAILVIAAVASAVLAAGVA